MVETKMPGKLFVVGVGPGDPELLTLKAARILKDVTCIVVPKGREEGSSLALSIIQGAVSMDGKEIVEAYFPMRKTRSVFDAHVGAISGENLVVKWQETVDEVVGRLSRGIDIAFITIGDPSIYSTFFYIHDSITESIPNLIVEMVPGVSSINASAARAGLSLGLGNERIAVLPANYLENLKETLESFDTVVLMKIHSVFDEVKEILQLMGLAGKAVVVSRAGMDDERIIEDIDNANERDLSYFSLMIVRNS